MRSRAISRLSLPEFVALMGMTFATVAFSIDAMLPAMTEIACELVPEAPNRAQLIVTSFVLGMGVGTLFTGPLSDRFGRKPVILWGGAVYVLGAGLAWAAGSLELVLAARVLQGLGAAGPRIAAMAIVRDLYEGRQMARVMSFAMIVFTLVPAVAPLMGAGIIWLAGWRAIFLAFIAFAVISGLWLGLRQPETLAPGHRRTFEPATLAAGIVEILSIHRVRLAIAALSFVFGLLFTTISTIQPIFEHSFDAAASFPYWFGAVALISGAASLLNARIVVSMGMRRVIVLTLAAECVLTLAMLAATWSDLPASLDFALFLIWMQSVFFVAGLTIGNLNALGMEPLGHLAGLGASVIGSLATVAAVLIAIPVGLAFDGTPLPLMWGVLISSVCALALTRMIEDLPG